MVSGIVFDIRRYSIQDGPGIRTAVFFKGCPMKCRWCHNPEGQAYQPEILLRQSRCILCDDCLEVCPNGAIKRQDDMIRIDRNLCKTRGACVAVCNTEALQIVGREMTVQQVIGKLEEDAIFYNQSNGGVTFTGGEPLAQPGFLRELLAACHAINLPTCVETCGFSSWSNFMDILPLVDLFLFDLKLMDDKRHIKWTHVSNDNILSNLEQLTMRGSKLQIRLPIIPGITDDKENIRQMGAFLASLTCKPSVELLPYHKIAEAKYASLGLEFPLAYLKPPSSESLLKTARLLESFHLEVMI